MREILIPKADHHVRPSRHSGVHGVLAKDQAVLGVHRPRWQTSDRVTRVYVLHRHLDSSLGEIAVDLAAQEDADVFEPPVAGRVVFNVG